MKAGTVAAEGAALVLPLPLGVAYGGRELQLLRTLDALREAGVAARRLDWWSPEERPALVHCFGAEGSLWELAARARGHGARIVVSPILVFGRSLRRQAAWARVDRLVPMKTSFRMRRDLLRLADAVIALTLTEARVVRDLFGVREEAIHVVPNGVDEVFRAADPALYRARHGAMPFVLSVGSIERRKGQLDVLHAARAAGRRVVFIGAARGDDPYGNALAAEITRSGNNAAWLDDVEPGSPLLASAYAAADVLVLASVAEGLPLVALEAAAAGTPLLLSDLPQHAEAFPMARRFPAGNVGALTRALSDLPARGTVPSMDPWSWGRVGAAVRDVYRAVAPQVVGE